MSHSERTLHRPGWPTGPDGSFTVGPGRDVWEAFARLATDEQVEQALVACAKMLAARYGRDPDHERQRGARRARPAGPGGTGALMAITTPPEGAFHRYSSQAEPCGQPRVRAASEKFWGHEGF